MENLDALTSEALQAIEQAGDISGLDQLRVQFLGKKRLLYRLIERVG